LTLLLTGEWLNEQAGRDHRGAHRQSCLGNGTHECSLGRDYSEMQNAQFKMQTSTGLHFGL
jgi:hypothetical protein